MFSYKSTPKNFLAKIPTTNDITATETLINVISLKRDPKGSSCATEV